MGDVVTLDGPMGAGKTTLVQHLGKALGISQRMTSPTFVLICEYEDGRLPVAHLDVYRLGEAADDDEGALALAPEVESLLNCHAMLVEWACYAPTLFDPLTTLSIRLNRPNGNDMDMDEGGIRQLVITPKDAYWKAALASETWRRETAQWLVPEAGGHPDDRT